MCKIGLLDIENPDNFIDFPEDEVFIDFLYLEEEDEDFSILLYYTTDTVYIS